MNAIPLPTQFIYEFSIDQDLVDRSLEYFLSLDYKSVKSVKDNNSAELLELTGITTKNGHTVTSFYHKELFNELEKCIDQVAKKHFKNQKLVICDSWLTRSKFGQSGSPHWHTWSVFSGLLYMTDQEKSNTIFSLDDPFFEKHKSLFGTDSVYKIPYDFSIKPVKGKLIIWDSSLMHRIGPIPEKNTRYTLAFNTWMTGNISTLSTGTLICDVVDVGKMHQQKN
jgi:hypothetical protein